MPLVSAYDGRERPWSAPAPLRFQRRIWVENRAIAVGSIGKLLGDALTHPGLIDPLDGEALHYTPHDFRRMFITDAILNGLPPHIAQVIAGHQDINVTLGYKAVYPDEAIQAHLAFLARRRSLRPSEEYRTPTDEEWQEFLGHFERRKDCARLAARCGTVRFDSPSDAWSACLLDACAIPASCSSMLTLGMAGEAIMGDPHLPREDTPVCTIRLHPAIA